MSEPSAEVRLQQALAAYQRGMVYDAETLCEALLRQRPGHVGALHLAGIIALQTRRAARGVALLGEAVRLRPDYAEAHRDLGSGLLTARQFDAALACFDRAIALKPDHAEALYNRALTLSHLGRHEDALACHDRAIALRPDQAVLHNSRASTLCYLQRYDAALAGYANAIALQPNFAEAHGNRGIALARLHRYAEALESYDRAIALNADAAETQYSRGVALIALHRHEDAVASFDQAIKVKTDYAEALWNQGVCLLLLGQFDRGWRQFEWRKRLERPVADRALPKPLWLGEPPIAGRTLFIHAEQGLGDTLQFCRYAVLAAQRGAHVVLSVQNPLRRLLRTLGTEIVILGSDEVPAEYDFHCPMLSLPLAFGSRLETIPARTPYLAADPAAVAQWRGRLAALPDGHAAARAGTGVTGRGGVAGALRVGLCWAGDPRPDQPTAHATDLRRSITLAQYAPLLAVAGVSFVSLQKGVAAAQAARPPDGMALHDWTDELGDFADTAALIEALDLVISVDTAVAHAAAALGKPVWILSRFDGCWRWLKDRDDTPWYPSARLWRQSAPGDWDGVMARIVPALHDLAWQAGGSRGRRPA